MCLCGHLGGPGWLGGGWALVDRGEGRGSRECTESDWGQRGVTLQWEKEVQVERAPCPQHRLLERLDLLSSGLACPAVSRVTQFPGVGGLETHHLSGLEPPRCGLICLSHSQCQGEGRAQASLRKEKGQASQENSCWALVLTDSHLSTPRLCPVAAQSGALISPQSVWRGLFC